MPTKDEALRAAEVDWLRQSVVTRSPWGSDASMVAAVQFNGAERPAVFATPNDSLERLKILVLFVGSKVNTPACVDADGNALTTPVADCGVVWEDRCVDMNGVVKTDCTTLKWLDDGNYSVLCVR